MDRMKTAPRSVYNISSDIVHFTKQDVGSDIYSQFIVSIFCASC